MNFQHKLHYIANVDLGAAAKYRTELITWLVITQSRQINKKNEVVIIGNSILIF